MEIQSEVNGPRPGPYPVSDRPASVIPRSPVRSCCASSIRPDVRNATLTVCVSNNVVARFILFGASLAGLLRNSSPFKGEVGRGMGAFGVYCQPIPTLALALSPKGTSFGARGGNNVAAIVNHYSRTSEIRPFDIDQIGAIRRRLVSVPCRLFGEGQGWKRGPRTITRWCGSSRS